MRLVFVSHSADRMGAELGLVSLVAEAVRRGHAATVLVPRAGPLVTDLIAAGAEVVVLPTRQWLGRRYNPLVGSVRLAQAAWSVPRYRRYLARARPDLVFTNSAAVPAAAVAARLLGIRHVWLVQESVLTNPNLRAALPRRTVARLIVRLSDEVIALSGYVAGQLRDAAPAVAGKLRVIPPPIDLPAGPPSPARPAGSDRLRRLVLLGRFTPEKGHADAVAAVGICRRRGYPLRLKLAAAGGAPARRAVAALARAHGVGELVETCEWTDDPQGLYAWADATLMLSRNEAYGRVTLESLGSGTPVVGYRAGGTTELLDPGGGVLVEPGVEALADALVDLAADAERYRRVKAEAERRGRQLRDQPSSAAAFLAQLEQLDAVR